MYRQFACTCLCVCTRTARRGYQISCYSQFQPVLSLQVVLGPNLDPMEEQHAFLIIGPSFSTRILAFNVRKCGCLLTIATFWRQVPVWWWSMGDSLFFFSKRTMITRSTDSLLLHACPHLVLAPLQVPTVLIFHIYLSLCSIPDVTAILEWFRWATAHHSTAD